MMDRLKHHYIWTMALLGGFLSANDSWPFAAFGLVLLAVALILVVRDLLADLRMLGWAGAGNMPAQTLAPGSSERHYRVTALVFRFVAILAIFAVAAYVAKGTVQ